MQELRFVLGEDNQLIRNLLTEMLLQLGHEVCAAVATEAEVEEATKRLKPDIIIIDLGLGSGSGLEAINKILKRTWIPHVYISGASQRSPLLGPDDILVFKPFRKADLVAAVERALKMPKPSA